MHLNHRNSYRCANLHIIGGKVSVFFDHTSYPLFFSTVISNPASREGLSRYEICFFRISAEFFFSLYYYDFISVQPDCNFRSMCNEPLNVLLHGDGLAVRFHYEKGFLRTFTAEEQLANTRLRFVSS